MLLRQPNILKTTPTKKITGYFRQQAPTRALRGDPPSVWISFASGNFAESSENTLVGNAKLGAMYRNWGGVCDSEWLGQIVYRNEI